MWMMTRTTQPSLQPCRVRKTARHLSLQLRRRSSSPRELQANRLSQSIMAKLYFCQYAAPDANECRMADGTTMAAGSVSSMTKAKPVPAS